MRVVKGDMAVFSDSHADDIDSLVGQQAGIAGYGGGVVGGVVRDVIHVAERDFVEQALFQEVAETLRRVGRKPDVFVHVEGVDAFPGNRTIGNQSGQEFVLRRSGSEDHADLRFPLQQLPYRRRNISGSLPPHRLPVRENIDG